jgi:hypothetical protein
LPWSSISTEPSAKHLEDLSNVFPQDVTSWWNLNKGKLPDDLAPRADPVADLFVAKREERDGITVKEFRNRFRRLMEAKSRPVSESD